MAIVAKTYVQALLNSSKDNKESIMFEKGLKDIATLFADNQEFKNLLLNPCISDEEKLTTIKEVFSEYFSNGTFANFITELLNKKRINIIEDISDEYSKINSALNKEVTIKIVVASAISEKEIEDIVNKYKEIYNANTVNYTVEIDKEVIGGIKVIVGNKTYDSTLQTQLSQIF